MADISDCGERCGTCNVFTYPVNVFRKLCSPPRPNQESVLFWYIPAAGGASYTAFSLHIFNPNTLASVLPNTKHAVANALLFNAHLGTGLYLFSRKHLARLPLSCRIGVSVYGTLIFNFGSVLLWAVTKVILPDHSIARAIFAIFSSCCMLFIGKEYVDYVDKNFVEKV